MFSMQNTLYRGFLVLLAFYYKTVFSPNKEKNPSCISFLSLNKFEKKSQQDVYSVNGRFQLLDLIKTELKSHMTC